ncbi:MAG: gliding motility-associated C-terminal domain-containing protein [Bacteroidota bacterium]
MASTTYTLILTDDNGCIVQDDIRIIVDPTVDLYLPNAFSPNGDGVNDRFNIFGNSNLVAVNSFRVYNRWEDVVYQVNDFPLGSLTDGWDGTFAGRPLDSGI